MLPQLRVDFGVESQLAMTSLVLAEVLLKVRHHSRDGLTDDVDEFELRKELFQVLWNLVDEWQMSFGIPLWSRPDSSLF